MARVTVRFPGSEDDVAVDVREEPVLLGRNPDAAGLEPELRAGVRAVSINSHSVSSNHALIRRVDGVLRVRDVHSRNGTWLRVPDGGEVELAHDAELALQLGMPSVSPGREDEPEEAHWTDEGDFAAGVRIAVERWLEREGVAARVTCVEGERQEPSTFADRIPLDKRSAIVIAPLETVDARWPLMVARIWRYVNRQHEIFQSERETRQEGLVLAAPSMRQAHRAVVEAARAGAPLLLMGPSGSGKEGLARCYHRHTGRPGPLVARNCSMFNRELLRSELFGAEAGAFTGCVRRLVGAVERAHGGTLFLDELGELSSDVQPMLLRFLDSGEYERMGSYGQPREADVRIVCATNKDLREAVMKGEFRADLWYRLSIRVINIPPLAERFEDLVAYLKTQQLSTRTTAYEILTTKALDLLRDYTWPGNFRELANFVGRLPRDSKPGSLEADGCRRLLDQGALAPRGEPRATTPLPLAGIDWSQIATAAASAFAEDYDKPGPRSWDDVKDYVEKYLKPLLFAHLSSVDATRGRDGVDAQELATRLEADRGTAVKQLNRYFERFCR